MSSRALANESAPRDLTTVETRSYSWGTRYGPKHTALIRVDGAVAILQHVRTTAVRTGRGESACEINDTPSLRDIPSSVLDELRGEGFDVVADHNRTTVDLGGARP